MGVLLLEDLLRLRETWRSDGLRVVLTNGVFDLLHSGHVAYLVAARARGDRLVVGLNSDVSTRAIKGPLRPLVPEDERATLLAELRCIDAVTIFDEHTAEALVDVLRPEIYVKGGDYEGAAGTIDEQRLPEARVARSYGAQVVLIPYLEGRSTSALIRRIVERYARAPQDP